MIGFTSCALADGPSVGATVSAGIRASVACSPGVATDNVVVGLTAALCEGSRAAGIVEDEGSLVLPASDILVSNLIRNCTYTVLRKLVL
jgi:hypothetical protein